MSQSPAKTRWSTLIFLIVWFFSIAYVAGNLKRGWVPHDEGILGQAAERVLHGEMPHRDFNDPYTGGLSYLNAAAFRVLGINLLTLRIVLFMFFVLWVPAVFAAAREFSGPLASAAVTLAAVAWSVPNYSAAMPSWFCLFFATFGTLALLKYIRNPRIELLILAGLCGGLSVLIKTPGLYFVAGALLFFVYREQSLAQRGEPSNEHCYAYFSFVVVSLALFITAICKLVLTTGGWGEFFHFVYPAVAIVILLVIRETISCGLNSAARFRTLLTLVAPFTAAAALPILLFFAMYWRRGAVHQLIVGLFVYHLRRILEANWPAPGPIFLIPTIVLAALVFQIARMWGVLRSSVSALIILLAALLLITSRGNYGSYQILFQSIRNIVPVITTAGLLTLHTRRKTTGSSEAQNEQIMLLICVTAMCSLIQFPFAFPLYFCYVAPLAMLCAAALMSKLPTPPRLILYASAITSILFGVFVLRPGFINRVGVRYEQDEQTTRLSLPRAGGLRVSKSSADEYNELIPFVRQLAGGQPILAGPDSPEIYFLSGLPNQTPIFFDFFHDATEYRTLMQGMLCSPSFVHVVVIKSDPQLSRYHRDILKSLVVDRFPNTHNFPSFEVFWRP
jgi:hypothetical protein